MEAAAFARDSRERGQKPGEARIRSTAGEYTPIAVLRNGSLAIVSTIQDDQQKRFGFAWRTVELRQGSRGMPGSLFPSAFHTTNRGDPHRMTKRIAILVVLGILVAGAPGRAEAQTSGGGQARRNSSVAKRVAWTLVGAAAGFGAGAWFGLLKFDDAINSDRKVWTSAIIGAAAGGFAGGLLSRNIGPAPSLPPSRIAWPDRSAVLQPADAIGGSTDDHSLRARIRALSYASPPVRR